MTDETKKATFKYIDSFEDHEDVIANLQRIFGDDWKTILVNAITYGASVEWVERGTINGIGRKEQQGKTPQVGLWLQKGTNRLFVALDDIKELTE